MRLLWMTVGVSFSVACSDPVLQAAPEGRNVIVRMEPEPEGSNCPAGGLSIVTGRDVDGDGVLAEEEVDTADTKYVCHGVQGETGTPRNMLIETSEESPGARCPWGGIRVETG